MTKFERQAHEQGLPGMSEGPLTWAAHVAYLASVRMRKIETGMPYEAFEELIAELEVETAMTRRSSRTLLRRKLRPLRSRSSGSAGSRSVCLVE